MSEISFQLWLCYGLGAQTKKQNKTKQHSQTAGFERAASPSPAELEGLGWSLGDLPPIGSIEKTTIRFEGRCLQRYETTKNKQNKI